MHIAESCARLSSVGHFASVALANEAQSFDESADVLPLWRGYGAHALFDGLVT